MVERKEFSNIGREQMSQAKTEKFIIAFSDKKTPAKEQAAKAFGQKRFTVLSGLNMAIVNLNDQEIKKLRRSGIAASITKDRRVDLIKPIENLDSLTGVPFSPSQNPFSKAKPSWAGGDETQSSGQKTDPGIEYVRGSATFVADPGSPTVYVLDTGVSDPLGELNITQNKDFTGSNNPADENGHGTHVSGIIGALDNSVGIRGVAPGVKIANYKVLDARGAGSLANIARALDHIAIHGSPGDVVNMSLGWEKKAGDPVDVAIPTLIGRGIRVVAAAGNENTDVDSKSPAHNGDPFAPGKKNGFFTVVAAQKFEFGWGRAYFSNYDAITNSSDIDNSTISAPGVEILSLTPAGDTIKYSGSSMASPMVAGALAYNSGIYRGPDLTDYYSVRGNKVVGTYKSYGEFMMDSLSS